MGRLHQEKLRALWPLIIFYLFSLKESSLSDKEGEDFFYRCEKQILNGAFFRSGYPLNEQIEQSEIGGTFVPDFPIILALKFYIDHPLCELIPKTVETALGVFKN